MTRISVRYSMRPTHGGKHWGPVRAGLKSQPALLPSVPLKGNPASPAPDFPCCPKEGSPGLFSRPLGTPALPQTLVFFHLSIRHLFLINALLFKLCAENDEKETLCGVWDLFKAWESVLECVFYSFYERCMFPSLCDLFKSKV